MGRDRFLFNLGALGAAVPLIVASGGLVSAPGVSRWLTLANGRFIAALGGAGFVVHEITTERVIHVLEVLDRSANGR